MLLKLLSMSRETVLERSQSRLIQEGNDDVDAGRSIHCRHYIVLAIFLMTWCPCRPSRAMTRRARGGGSSAGTTSCWRSS